MVQSSVQSTLISDGYAAFNADQWGIVEALFCQDIPGADGPNFPVWHAMDGETHKGRAKIFAHLKALRAAKVKANLVGVADHGHTSITLDISTGGTEGPHACADRVEFDESGHITEFWHCSTASHKHPSSS